MELDEIIALSVKHNASDLHLCCGHFPGGDVTDNSKP